MRGKRTFLIAPVVAVAVVALAVAGCGSSSDNVKASPPAASAKRSTPSGGQRHRRRARGEPRQLPRRLAGPHALPVREGHRHDEHLLRRLRERLAALHHERPPEGGLGRGPRPAWVPPPARTASPSSPTTATRSTATPAIARRATRTVRASRRSAAAGTSSRRPVSRSKATRPLRPRTGAAMATSASRMGGLPAARRAAGAVRWFDGVYALGAACSPPKRPCTSSSSPRSSTPSAGSGRCSWPTPRPASWPRRAWPSRAPGPSPRSRESRSPSAPWPVSCSATEPACWAGPKPAGEPRSRWPWRRKSVRWWRWRQA